MREDELVELIDETARARSRPIVVGVSGFGGSGKSTLARELASRPEWTRIRGDDFLDPDRSHHRSTDWDGVERVRLVEEVLTPFRAGRPGRYRRYDWSLRALSEPQPVPSGRVLVVDVIGLLHPEALPSLDVSVWCDVDLETATARGLRRDAELGRDHERLWHEIWVPNEIDFAARFDPRARADVRIDRS